MPSYTTTVTTPTGKSICSNHDDMIIEVMYVMAEGMAKVDILDIFHVTSGERSRMNGRF